MLDVTNAARKSSTTWGEADRAPHRAVRHARGIGSLPVTALVQLLLFLVLLLVLLTAWGRIPPSSVHSALDL